MNKYRKPVIILVGPQTPPTGGMESIIQELLHSDLKNSCHIIYIDNSKPAFIHRASLKHGGYRASLLRNPFSSLFSIGLSSVFWFRYVYQLLSKPVDLIHIHTASYASFWEKMPYILIGKFLHKPVLLHIHGARFMQFYQSGTPTVRLIIKKMISICDRIIVLSEYWRKFFQTIIENERIDVVENSIDLSDFAGTETVKSRIPRVLFLGELSNRKGIEDFLQVARYVSENNIMVHFMAAGPGDIAKLNSRAVELNVDDCIFFLPPVFGWDKLQLLKQSWIFLLPSYAEGMPLAIIEALAAGLPVISTRVGGVPDMIQDGVNGFLVEPGDIKAMGNSIIKIVQNEALRIKLAENNYSLAEQRFNITGMQNKLLKIYTVVIRGALYKNKLR